MQIKKLPIFPLTNFTLQFGLTASVTRNTSNCCNTHKKELEKSRFELDKALGLDGVNKMINKVVLTLLTCAVLRIKRFINVIYKCALLICKTYGKCF